MLERLGYLENHHKTVHQENMMYLLLSYQKGMAYVSLGCVPCPWMDSMQPRHARTCKASNRFCDIEKSISAIILCSKGSSRVAGYMLYKNGVFFLTPTPLILYMRGGEIALKKNGHCKNARPSQSNTQTSDLDFFMYNRLSNV